MTNYYKVSLWIEGSFEDADAFPRLSQPAAFERDEQRSLDVRRAMTWIFGFDDRVPGAGMKALDLALQKAHALTKRLPAWAMLTADTRVTVSIYRPTHGGVMLLPVIGALSAAA